MGGLWDDRETASCGWPVSSLLSTDLARRATIQGIQLTPNQRVIVRVLRGSLITDFHVCVGSRSFCCPPPDREDVSSATESVATEPWQMSGLVLADRRPMPGVSSRREEAYEWSLLHLLPVNLAGPAGSSGRFGSERAYRAQHDANKLTGTRVIAGPIGIARQHQIDVVFARPSVQMV